jgi:hypothetical protein
MDTDKHGLGRAGERRRPCCGARASARFNDRFNEALEISKPPLFRTPKRRERRAPQNKFVQFREIGVEALQ